MQKQNKKKKKTKTKKHAEISHKEQPTQASPP